MKRRDRERHTPVKAPGTPNMTTVFLAKSSSEFTTCGTEQVSSPFMAIN